MADDLMKELEVEDGTIFLEPREVYDKGIMGVTDDKCHVVYGYYKLAKALADSYKESIKAEKSDDEWYDMAFEWLDYNTIRGIPYMDKDHRPIVVYEYQA